MRNELHSLGHYAGHAQVELDKLQPRIPKLTIVIEGANPSDVSVNVDEVQVPSDLLGVERYADPGQRKITGKRGNEVVSETLTLAEGGNRQVILKFQNAPMSALPSIAAHTTNPAPPNRPNARIDNRLPSEATVPTNPTRERGVDSTQNLADSGTLVARSSNERSGLDSKGHGTRGSYQKLLIGVHFAADIWYQAPTKGVCSKSSVQTASFNCYRAGSDTVDSTKGSPDNIPLTSESLGPEQSGVINSGLALTTMRALVSFDYAVMATLTLGARIGVAFNGGPPSLRYESDVPYPSTKFLPIHAEGRVAYWFRALSQEGVLPYVHVSGGLAQVDGKVTVDTYAPDNSPRKLDAWKMMGQGFATIGGGALFPLGEVAALQGNINVMYMLPSTGLIFEPSLGFVVRLL